MITILVFFIALLLVAGRGRWEGNKRFSTGHEFTQGLDGSWLMDCPEERFETHREGTMIVAVCYGDPNE